MEVRRLVITNRDSSPLCHDCGLCCTMVSLSQPAEIWLAGDVTPREREWFKSDLVELSISEAVATGLLVDGLKHEGMHFYKCQRWDPDTGNCTDYDNRPDVCRGFPYYLVKGNRRQSIYTLGCRLADFVYSLRDMNPQEIELRKNGQG